MALFEFHGSRRILRRRGYLHVCQSLLAMYCWALSPLCHSFAFIRKASGLAALNMVVWTALTAYLLLFVLPYLILGGWRRGMFYILLLAVGLSTENILTAYSPAWFMLPADSAGSFLLVAFFVLANALLFDWLFSEITREKTVCLCCGSHIEKGSRFCNTCGFAQG